MRTWFDLPKLKSRDLTAEDVLAAVREQNVQVAAGARAASRQAIGTRVVGGYGCGDGHVAALYSGLLCRHTKA